MDGAENVISVRSGRDAEWTTPLFIQRKPFVFIYLVIWLFIKA